jgi:hypothetical protein
MLRCRDTSRAQDVQVGYVASICIVPFLLRACM